jgi:hypothetical protein
MVPPCFATLYVADFFFRLGQIAKKLVAPISSQQLTQFLTDLTEQEAVVDGEPEAEELLTRASSLLQQNNVPQALQYFSEVGNDGN